MMRTILATVLLIFGSLQLACKTDTGLEPTRSGFQGTVYFENNWPEATEQVLVVAATKFPPTAIIEIVLGDPLPLFTDSVRYEIFTTPQKFAAVGVIWKEKDQPWDVTNIIGIYFPTENKFQPGGLEIKNRDEMIKGIDIHADLSKARIKVNSSIQGTIRAKGEWPASAEAVLIAASGPLIPNGLLDIILSSPISVPFDSTDYSMYLQPGLYRMIAALVIEKDQALAIETIKGGLYYRNPNDFLWSTVDVPNDSALIKGIDITIDFNKKLLPVAR